MSIRLVVVYVVVLAVARVLTLVGRRPQSWQDTLRSFFDPTYYIIGWTSTLALAAPLGEYLLFERPQLWWLQLAGALAIIISGLIIAEANRALGPSYTPYVDRDATTKEMVTRGLYNYIRHPIYLAGFLLTAGAALMFNSRWAWFFTALAWGALMLRVSREERLLKKNMPGYAAYARRTKRFIPWIF
jgi:protein-S-isoprenylcysteine O-methyltransferase Ste14